MFSTAVIFILILMAQKVLAAETTAPVITLSTPNDYAVSFINNTTFTFTPADDSEILWCRVVANDSVLKVNNAISNNTASKISNVLFANNGTYGWLIQCLDLYGNTGNSTLRNLRVLLDKTSPNITLNLARTGSDTSARANFTYTPVDSESGLSTCKLYVDKILKESTSSPSNNSENIFKNIQLSHGTFFYSINCTDANGNEGTTGNAMMVVEGGSVITITLASPAEQAVDTTGIITFQYTPVSSSNITWCGLYLDNDTSNISSSKITNNTVNNFTKLQLSNKLWNWKVRCMTSAGEFSNSTTTRTLNVSVYKLVSTYVEIELNEPADNTLNTRGVIDFKYTPTTTISTIEKCELIVNDSVRSSKSGISSDAVNTFSEVEVSNGAWEWKVRCTDTENKTYASKLFSLDVEKTTTTESDITQPTALENETQEAAAVEESIAPTGAEMSGIKLLLIIISVSIPLMVITFFASQEKYRAKLHDMFMLSPKDIARKKLKIYIMTYLDKGFNEEKIRSHLSMYKWPQSDIDKVFSEIRRTAKKVIKKLPLPPPPARE